MREPVQLSADVIARYRRGELTGADVGMLYRIPAAAALKLLRQAGVDTSKHRGRRRGVGKPVQFSADILARYATGELDHRAIGELYRIGSETVLRELRRAGADTSRSTRAVRATSRQPALGGNSCQALPNGPEHVPGWRACGHHWPGGPANIEAPGDSETPAWASSEKEMTLPVAGHYHHPPTA